ncbi:hypothetical protein CYMTET_15703, partial [Cymbomonas tetramitiformis]
MAEVVPGNDSGMAGQAGDEGLWRLDLRLPGGGGERVYTLPPSAGMGGVVAASARGQFFPTGERYTLEELKKFKYGASVQNRAVAVAAGAEGWAQGLTAMSDLHRVMLFDLRRPTVPLLQWEHMMERQPPTMLRFHSHQNPPWRPRSCQGTSGHSLFGVDEGRMEMPGKRSGFLLAANTSGDIHMFQYESAHPRLDPANDAGGQSSGQPARQQSAERGAPEMHGRRGAAPEGTAWSAGQGGEQTAESSTRVEEPPTVEDATRALRFAGGALTALGVAWRVPPAKERDGSSVVLGRRDVKLTPPSLHGVVLTAGKPIGSKALLCQLTGGGELYLRNFTPRGAFDDDAARTSASCSGLEASPGGDLCSRCPAASSAVADDAGPADIERATPHPREAPGHDSWPEPSKAKPPPLNDVEVYPGASKDLRPKFGSQYHKVPRIHGFVSTGIISMVGS